MLSVDRSKPRHYGDERGRYWSVSQVVDVVTGGCDYYTHGSAERGTDIHEIFALHLGASMGWCEPPDVPAEYQGYDSAILSWIQQAKPQPMMLERTLKHNTYPYAGTLDFVGMIGEDYGVLDLKTGSGQRGHSVQIHGYKQLVDKASKMWLLYINADGAFKLSAVKYSSKDWAVFQNGLSILQWRTL